MINEQMIKRYCREDISLIENYEKAIADSQTWHCHHRDEVKVLPSGITVVRSREDLIEAGRYYDCPSNELIFLTLSEHNRLHHKGKTPWNKGKTGIYSEETKTKMSAARKGENNPRYGKPGVMKGKKLGEETKAKMSAARKGNTNHKGFIAKSIEEHYGKPISEIRKIYEAEKSYYYRHKKFRWEMIEERETF